jgi:hypothetical protein
MPKIIDREPYGGAETRIRRLGIKPLIDEIEFLVTDFPLLIKEERNANGAAAIRVMLDKRFEVAGGWKITKSGGIDWQKSLPLNNSGAEVCVGVELQISARSDLLTNDLTHLMKAIEDGLIDVGVIIVPANGTARFLTDRCPSFASALDHVKRAKGQFSPILIWSIGHDGSGPALPKKRTNLGKLIESILPHDKE